MVKVKGLCLVFGLLAFRQHNSDFSFSCLLALLRRGKLHRAQGMTRVVVEAGQQQKVSLLEYLAYAIMKKFLESLLTFSPFPQFTHAPQWNERGSPSSNPQVERPPNAKCHTP